MAVAGWTRPDMLLRYTKAQASRRAAEEAKALSLGELLKQRKRATTSTDARGCPARVVPALPVVFLPIWLGGFVGPLVVGWRTQKEAWFPAAFAWLLVVGPLLWLLGLPGP